MSVSKTVFGRRKNTRWVVYCRNGKAELWARIIYQNYVLNGSEIPKGYVIHHKDENPKNDCLENLEMLTRGEHLRIHRTGKVCSFKTREKLSIIFKGCEGYSHSEESKKKISESLTGRKLSQEHCKNIGESQRGKKRGPHSLETKRKIGKGNKGKIHSEEQNKKLSQVLTGRELSNEHRKNISKSLKGKAKAPFSEEHRRNISNSCLGKKVSLATKQNMSEAAKRGWEKRKLNKTEEKELVIH